MFATLARAVFGSSNDRSLKGYQRRVPEINAFEPAMQALDGEALRAKTAEFRARLAEGATLDELLPEAFAAVREASRRVLGLRHFDVQMIGGMVLHDGKIAEMKTARGQDTGGDVTRLPERAQRPRRARRHRERLPGRPRFGVDGACLQLHGPDHRRDRARAERGGRSAGPTTATSRMARTTSSASTTCATT